MVLDVAQLDLEVSEATHGAFHETTWFFRNTLAEARKAWDRLRAEHGTRFLNAALSEPPLVVLILEQAGRASTTLLPIASKTYRAESVPGTDLAPIQFRLTPLLPADGSSYYLCRLSNGLTQCDCAEWFYRVDGCEDAPPCKHLAALMTLAWL